MDPSQLCGPIKLLLSLRPIAASLAAISGQPPHGNMPMKISHFQIDSRIPDNCESDLWLEHDHDCKVTDGKISQLLWLKGFEP